MERKVLLLDDDEHVRRVLGRYLKANGYEVEEASNLASALRTFESMRPDIAVFDFRLPDGTALDLLPKVKAIEPETPVIVMTGYGSMELGVALIKNGAEQCLTKPLEPPALLMVINKSLENTRNQQKQLASKNLRRRTSANPFLGASSVIRRLEDVARRVADSHSPVLIQGETGSGKGVLALWLHENGPRHEEPFVDLNCAGLSREFLETELFGHQKGAFTGAVDQKQGLFDVAHHGTLFLDEIGDVDVNIQPKLLKVLEEKKFRRLGDVRDRQVDVRLVAATHHNLRKLMDDRQFRSDLYFRISTVPLVLPSLRDRTEDIPELAAQILKRTCSEMGRSAVELTPRALERLREYAWPGNIRELRNVLERALLMSATSAALDAGDLFFEAATPSSGSAYNPSLTLEELERMHVELVYREEDANVERAAQRLGIPKSTLYTKLRAYGLTKTRTTNGS